MRASRLLGAVLAVVLLAATAVAVSRTRTADDPGAPPVADESPEPSPSASAPPPQVQPTPDREALGLLQDPEAAERAGAQALLDAGEQAARDDWADLGHPAWPVNAPRPVYVATVRLDDARRHVAADVVVALTSDEGSDTVLRLLAASDALADAGSRVTVTVRRDGQAAAHELDTAGARLLVGDPPPAGEPTLIRVQLSYDLVDRENILDEGGPAGFGLLAWNPSVSVLGHWLPVLTVPSNDGPLIPWGDVGAFPVAVWSVLVEHPGTVVVTGGQDGPCPSRVDLEGCTWGRGVALRDVSAVAYPTDVTLEQGEVRGVAVRSWVPPHLRAGAGEIALQESLASVELFAELLGPLAWREFDVVAAPLSRGAAGMEFPGLTVIRDDAYRSLDGGFGTFVLTHEVAHQWFHALVGNGSLSDPVVDESLAQYLSYVYYAELLGPEAADRLAAQSFHGRYEEARGEGLRDEPPAQPLAEFDGSSAYGPLVYARAPLAWLAAEDEVGRATVVRFLSRLVDEYGMGFLTDDQLLAEASEFSQPLADTLQRYWFDPTPLP